MSEPLPDVPSRGVLAWTIRTVGVLGLLTLFTTQAFVRLVGEPSKNLGIAANRLDPETTGSIGRAARGARLDPCALDKGRYGRH